MKRVQFSIGQGFTANGARLTGLRKRKNRAYRFIASTFGGFSASPNDGGWLDANGSLVIEPDLAITTVIPEEKLTLVDHAADTLAGLFNQASVLLTIDDVTARFSSHVETNNPKGDS